MPAAAASFFPIQRLPFFLSVLAAGRLAAAVQPWDPRFGPPSGSSENGSPGDSAIYTAASDGTNIYIGGQFTSIDGVDAANIARWDGSGWQGLGSGIGGPVRSIAFFGGKLIAGGTFNQAGGAAASNLAQWDGQGWSPVGAGVSTAGGQDSTVNALAAFGGSLYAAGLFDHAGGGAAANIARWDGASWQPLLMTYTNYVLLLPQVRTNNGITGAVAALSAWNGHLVAGGSFLQNIGARFLGPLLTLPVYGTNLIQWDGTNWSSLGWSAASFLGQAGAVSSLADYDGQLVAGGTFSLDNGDPFDGVALLSAAGWKSLGTGIAGSIRTLLSTGTNLYAGGYFSAAGGLAANSLASWDGTEWASLAQPPGGSADPTVVNALAADPAGNLYAGGLFTQLDATQVQNIAMRNAGGWNGLGCGLLENQRSGASYAMTRYHGKTVVGGAFHSAGGVKAANIAAWDGGHWSAFGNGLKGSVSAVAAIGDKLYAAGDFTIPDDPGAKNAAVWNGVRWAALGGGADRPVHALEVLGGDLYMGGEFLNAGGVHAEGIARWDGAAWNSVGSAQALPFGRVYALKAVGSKLYVGGLFGYHAPGNNIAVWDGSSWAPLGSGIAGRIYASVYAIESDGARLFVGGNFDTAGGAPVNSLALWDGISWSALGQPGGIVQSLCYNSGGQLFAGGAFTSGFGVNASNLAQWDGQSWSALGSGTGFPNASGSFVQAMMADGSDLLVAGNFSLAGGNSSYGFGVYHMPGISGTAGGSSPLIQAKRISGGFILQVSGDAAGYVIESADSVSDTSWAALVSLQGATNFTVDTATSRRFFRLRK